MTETDVRIANRLGLHARAAARFVHLANQFQSRVTVTRGDSRVDGKSILGLLTLAAALGSSIRIAADGDDEERAVDELRSLIQNRFGEES